MKKSKKQHTKKKNLQHCDGKNNQKNMTQNTIANRIQNFFTSSKKGHLKKAAFDSMHVPLPEVVDSIPLVRRLKVK